jgi:hypothetical protein
VIKIVSFLSLLLLSSCSQGPEEERKQVNKKAEPIVVGLKGLDMEADFHEITTFLNGNKIKQAQLSSEWKEACENKEPVWCFVNPQTKKGILYNYYAFADSRGIAPKDKILNRQEIEIIKSQLASNPKLIKFNWVEESSIERSFIGNNYDLKFVNFWFKEDSNSIDKVFVAYIDKTTNKLTVESVSPQNGYRIWLKK